MAHWTSRPAALIAAAVLASVAEAAPLRSPADADLYDVQFLGTRLGWAVGDDGVILHTADGGRTWKQQRTDTEASLRSVCFLSATVGWVVGREERPGGRSIGVVLFTEDGGRTWHRGLVNAVPGLSCARFLGPREGFLLGDGVAALPGGILQTKDGGKRWRAAKAPSVIAWSDAAFSDPETGVLLADDNKLYLMRRGRITAAEIDPLRERIHAVAIEGDRAFAVGERGIVLTSNSGGARWSFADIGLSEAEAKFLDWQTVATKGDDIWVAGEPGFFVLHSSDSGRTWQRYATGVRVPIRGLTFADARHGWAVGALGTILATADGGRTWHVQRRGGKRCALLYIHDFDRPPPLDLYAGLGLEQGYLVTSAAAAMEGSQPQPTLRVKSRYAYAVRRSGAATATVIHPTGDDLPQRIAVLLATWQPDAVVVDGDTALVDSVRKVVDRSDAESGKLLERLSLEPSSPSKVYVRSKTRSADCVTFDGTSFSDRLASAPADYVVSYAAIMGRTDSISTRPLAFRLIHVAGERLRQGSSLMVGLELRAANGASRKLPRLAAPDKKVTAGIQRLRRLRTLMTRRVSGLSHAMKEAAEFGRTLDDLPQEQGAPAVYAAAKLAVAQGKWPLAEQLFSTMVDHYPLHALSTDACLWLLRHGTSHEVQRRYSLEQFVDRQQATTSVQQTSFGLPAEIERDSLPGTTSNSGQRKIEPPRSEVVETKQKTLLANTADRHRRHLQSLMWAKQLMALGPLYRGDPALHYALLHIRRSLGKVGDLRAAYQNYLVQLPESAWHDAVRAELWLLDRQGQPPVPYLWAGRAVRKPYLDAAFDDACWRRSRVATLSPASEDRRYTTEIRVAHDEAFLYLGIRCTHPKSRVVAAARPRQRDVDLRAYDRISIRIDVDRDHVTAYCLEIDQRGCVRDACWGDVSWNPPCFIAFAGGEGEWRVEAAIPLGELVTQAVNSRSAWAVDVLRSVPRGPRQSLAPARDGAEQPIGRALLLFE